MNVVVIYRSKSGFVKKYAEWIAEELEADLFDVSKVTLSKLKTYDTIVFGGSLHAVGINGLNVIMKNFDQLKSKKLVVFASGASPANEKAVKHVTSSNFSQDQMQHLKFFYLRGGFDYNKLPIFDKFLMRLLKMKILRKKNKGMQLSSDEIGMLASLEKPADFTKKENIQDLLAYVRS